MSAPGGAVCLLKLQIDLRSLGVVHVSGKNVSGNQFVDALDSAVQRARADDEWRREYMTLYMRDRENLEKGREEGLKEGREEGALDMLFGLVKKGLLSMSEAAKESGMEFSAFEKKYKSFLG